MTIQEFIELHGLTIESQRIPMRTDLAGDSFGKGAYHYLVTIKNRDEGLYSFPYSMGSAHVEKIPFGNIKLLGLGIRNRKDYDSIPLPGSRRGVTLWQEEAQKVVFKPKAPDLATVLDCLASDCSGIDSASGFEEWASELGYDADSRKAENIYNACRDSYRKLEHMLGRTAMQSLLNDVERL